MDIHCKWIEDDEQMLVDTNGQVLPCCYLSGFFRLSHSKEKKKFAKRDNITDQLYYVDLVDSQIRAEYIYQEYDKRKDKLNIFTNDLEDILANDWFTEILPKSWKDEKLISGPCKRICDKDKSEGKGDIPLVTV